MKLTATPFNPQTGELLPVYRDAYLRGDLARSSAQAVEQYLSSDSTQAHHTLTRWHQLGDDQAATPNWVQKQVQYVRAQPVRFRQRALALVATGALLAGVTMAGTGLPSSAPAAGNLPAASAETAMPLGAESAEAAASSTVLVHGRILNEAGQPLVGATVMHKGTRNGVSTNADGSYLLRVPAGASATLQYGYGGLASQEVAVHGVAPAAVTLRPAGAVVASTAAASTAAASKAPAAPKRRHWLFF